MNGKTVAQSVFLTLGNNMSNKMFLSIKCLKLYWASSWSFPSHLSVSELAQVSLQILALKLVRSLWTVKSLKAQNV